MRQPRTIVKPLNFNRMKFPSTSKFKIQYFNIIAPDSDNIVEIWLFVCNTGSLTEISVEIPAKHTDDDLQVALETIHNYVKARTPPDMLDCKVSLSVDDFNGWPGDDEWRHAD